MMDFYDAAGARRSVRDFTEEQIPEDKLRKMIEAAYQAPANDHFRVNGVNFVYGISQRLLIDLDQTKRQEAIFHEQD